MVVGIKAGHLYNARDERRVEWIHWLPAGKKVTLSPDLTWTWYFNWISHKLWTWNLGVFNIQIFLILVIDYKIPASFAIVYFYSIIFISIEGCLVFNQTKSPLSSIWPCSNLLKSIPFQFYKIQGSAQSEESDSLCWSDPTLVPCALHSHDGHQAKGQSHKSWLSKFFTNSAAPSTTCVNQIYMEMGVGSLTPSQGSFHILAFLKCLPNYNQLDFYSHAIFSIK